MTHLSLAATFGADENSPLLRGTAAEGAAAVSSISPLVERRERPPVLFAPLLGVLAPRVAVAVAVDALGLLREGGLEPTRFFEDDASRYWRDPSRSSASWARVDLGGGGVLRGEMPRR